MPPPFGQSHRDITRTGEHKLAPLPRSVPLLRGRMPRRRRERGSELQPPISAGQPPYAAMRRILNQAANAAVKTKGSIFEIVYRRLVPRLGHAQTIGAVAHRLCRLIWKILHQGIRYEERGPSVSERARPARAARMIRELRSLGYRV